MKNGTIALYDKKGNHVDLRKYDCPAERNKLIKAWKNKYGPGFENCFLHVCPSFEIELVAEDGTNLRNVRVKGENGIWEKKYNTAP
jgi:hypothetical protein